MECECNDFSINSDYVYGEACVWLAERKRDCTIIDAGFGGNTGPHEVQRHLLKHGINVHTIGIDGAFYDAEVDEFIHADMCDVKLPGVADMVICKAVIHSFDDDPTKFKKIIENCADWLKPDGVLFTYIDCIGTLKQRILKQYAYTVMRAMSKNEAMKHASKCHMLKSNKCLHGKELKMSWPARIYCAQQNTK